MQLGEPVDIGMPIQTIEAECPFSHEKPNPEEKNELGGVGTTLGKNMANEKGVHKKVPPFGGDYTKAEKDLDPRDRSQKITSVEIEINGDTVMLNDHPLPYPLTCAAHHLIPAQEALRGHPILVFMCKDGEPQDFLSSGKDATAAVKGGTKVWGNVAYNVNGGQNGVWLPGNYAVGAGIGGVEVWKSRASDKRKTYSDAEAAENWINALDFGPDEWAQLAKDPEEQEDQLDGAKLAAAMATAKLPTYMLAGTNHKIDAGNPKWAYVKAAMDATDGQFHDRHEPYSKEVKDYLEKIAAAYRKMYDRSANPDSPCAECQKARVPAGAKASLVGPPYGIVKRLVDGSNFFKGYVHTKTLTAKNIYTSKWVIAWINDKASSNRRISG